MTNILENGADVSATMYIIEEEIDFLSVITISEECIAI